MHDQALTQDQERAGGSTQPWGSVECRRLCVLAWMNQCNGTDAELLRMRACYDCMSDRSRGYTLASHVPVVYGSPSELYEAIKDLERSPAANL